MISNNLTLLYLIKSKKRLANNEGNHWLVLANFNIAYTGFPSSCNNVLMQNVITTCAVKLKWPLNMCLQDLQLQGKSVTVQVLAPSRNSKQITHLQ